MGHLRRREKTEGGGDERWRNTEGGGKVEGGDISKKPKKHMISMKTPLSSTLKTS